MSQDQVLRTLVSLGLSEMDAKVYVFLAKRGAHNGRDIRKALKISKQQLYPSLRSLQNKGISSSTLEHPARFSVISFEKVLDLFIKARVEETQRLQQSKDEILSKWQGIEVAETDASKFTVIEGRNYIFSKIQQMIEATQSQILTIATVPSLLQADEFGLFEVGFGHPLKSKIQFRFLTELSSKNLNAIKTLLNETAKAGLNFEGRNPDLGLRLFPRMVIRDEDEAMFFIKPRTDTSIVEKDDVCLWTNCPALVKAFTGIFDELWRHSTDIKAKLVEIETGKPPPQVQVINSVGAARRKFDEILQSAKAEILLLTSSNGLLESSKSTPQFEKLTKEGISVKIMAPILRENSEAAEQLSKFCEVRHVPVNYLTTIIVDGRKLLQFKTSLPKEEKPKAGPLFEAAFFTENRVYSEAMKNALDDIWEKAQFLSSVKLDSIMQPFGPTVVPLPKDSLLQNANVALVDFEPPGTILEKDIVNKIIRAQKLEVTDMAKDTSRMYASMAMAVVQLPSSFGLPKMMLQAVHVESWSSFGGGCYLIVLLSHRTPGGEAFVPVAVVGQLRPKVQNYFEMILGGTPAAQNIQLVEDDELQVRVHGNTLFAGWTVPIQLVPKEHILPPGCMLVEGYGDVKPSGSTMVLPSGFKTKSEGNYLDAFVTFMHPSYNYSGPGTAGFLARDFVMTKTPPQKSGTPTK